MTKTPDVIAQEMLGKLRITAPGFSLEIGTPERKMLDAVAESISEAYIDQYLIGSLLDIEAKSGIELEQFCLVPGTSVVTPMGVVPIESLRAGDEVITHTGKPHTVLATSDRTVDEEVVTIRTAAGAEHTMTRNHPVLVTRRFSIDREWVPAGEVVLGDSVWGPEESALVAAVDTAQYQGSVHNIEVEGDNSYLLEGEFAVHNCGIFGFGRLQGRKAQGVVRVEMTTAAAQDIPVNIGTQFYTRQGLPGTSNPLYFTASQASVIPAGTYVIDIPVECTIVGTVGNVPPDSIVYLGEIIGASSVTNLTSMTGGVDVEADDELRQRFKDTFMRNIAGTEDWYLGLCYQNKNVSKAACFGPIRKYSTQIAVPNVTLTLPVTADVKYAWPDGESVFKNLGQQDEVFYRPIDDYVFVSGSSPQITRVGTGAMVVGDVVDVEFEYTTRSSRNSSLDGIVNKVDVFANGADPHSITERTVLTAQTLSTNTAEPLWTGNFARMGSAGNPSATNRFMRLGSVPILSFPSSVVVGTTNYQQGVHYHVLRGITLNAGSIREVAGLEWLPAGPAVDTPLTLTYVYNRVPEVLQAVLKKGKQLTTDVLVHQANYAYLKVYLSIEYDRGFVVSQVVNAIQTRLRSYFAGMPYGAWLEISDVALSVHQVIGVDNVTLTTSTENPVDYGIKVYGDSSDTVPLVIQTDDFKLVDSQLPVFLEAVCFRKPNR